MSHDFISSIYEAGTRDNSWRMILIKTIDILPFGLPWKPFLICKLKTSNVTRGTLSKASIRSNFEVFKKNFIQYYFSCYILFNDQVAFLAFTSWDVKLYLYCDCLFPRLWRQNFETFSFLSSCFPAWPKKSGQKFRDLKNEKRF